MRAQVRALRERARQPREPDPAVDEITMLCLAYEQGDHALTAGDLALAADRFRLAAGARHLPEYTDPDFADVRDLIEVPAVLRLIDVLLRQGDVTAALAWCSVAAAADGLAEEATALLRGGCRPA